MAVGAAVALRFAARHPDRVQLALMSLVLGVVVRTGKERMLARAARIEAEGIAAIAEEELAITYPTALRANGRSLRPYRATWLGNDVTSYAATYRTLAKVDIDVGPDVASIAVLTLVPPERSTRCVPRRDG